MTGFLIAGLIAMAAPAQNTDTTFAMRAGSHLLVESDVGSVKVRSWNRNEVRVQARHTSRTEVEIDRSSSVVSIEASTRNGGRAEVDYTITVPRSFVISIEGANTEVDIEGIDGDVSVETLAGGIDIRNVAGYVQAESVSGFINVDGIRGRVSVSTSNQGVRVTNVTGDVDAEAINGSITLLGLQSTRVSAETVNGGITIGSTVRDGGSYTAATTNGSITMAIPEGTSASVETSTFSGSTQASFPITLDRRGGGNITFRLGGGSAKIELEAFSGSIRFVRPSELKDPGDRQKSKSK